MVQLHRLPHLLRREIAALPHDLEEGRAYLEASGIGEGAVFVLLECRR